MPKPGAGMPPEVKAITAGIPSTSEMCAEAVASLGLRERSRQDISEHLDEVLKSMMDEGLKTLRAHQARVVRDLVELYLRVNAENPDRAVTFIEKGFTSLGNQRKKRAGVNMERYMKWLLEHCGIASEIDTSNSGQSDLVVPSAKVLLRRPELAVVLEFKHTTRERWKEVRDENARSRRQVWLVTLDDYICKANVSLIGAGNIVLYVPDRVFLSLDNCGTHFRSLNTLIPDLQPFGDISRLDASSLPDPPSSIRARGRKRLLGVRPVYPSPTPPRFSVES